MAERDARRLGRRVKLLSEFPVIHLAHIGEPRTKLIFIFTDKRIVSKEINMICHQHYITTCVIGIHYTAGV